MIRWIPYTFVRTVAFFIAGILLAIYLPGIIPQQTAMYVLAGMGALYVLFFILRRRYAISVSVFGFVALPAILACGYLHLLNQTDRLSPEHFLHENNIAQYRVSLTSYAEEKDKSWKVSGKVTHFRGDRWKQTHGNVLIYFPKKDFAKPFNYGDVLLINGAPQSVPPPANPGEFDYQRFLTYRNIYHQHFVSGENVRFLKHDPENILKDYAIQARQWADNVLHRYVTGDQEQAIASALVLGVTDGLDNELLNAYAATGAMHVLAVSGLHITIIYLIILWFFKPLSASKSGKWIVAAISLCILWAYAFITGLSPSVLRAVTMFTFIAIAKATSRSTNIYNTLAASGFCLLVYDPYLIMSVGFQLSYLAVLGIVYLQPLLYNLWNATTWLGDQIWKIVCVSIAAQLATFSLGLLYFHQFPNYFLLSNLLVIPISFGVLILGLALLAVNFISVLSLIIGFLLTWAIKVMNFCVVVVEWFPFSLVEGIYITTAQSWLLMFFIILLILTIQYKNFKYLIGSACTIAVFTILQWAHFYENNQKDTVTIYKVPGHRAADFISEGKAFFITDSILQTNTDKIRFHIKPNRLTSGVANIYTGYKNSIAISGGNIFTWKGKTIVWITGSEFVYSDGFKPDLIIVANDALQNLEMLRSSIGSTPLIFDSSNSFYYSRTMLKKAGMLNLKAHAVLQQGAFQFIIERNS